MKTRFLSLLFVASSLAACAQEPQSTTNTKADDASETTAEATADVKSDAPALAPAAATPLHTRVTTLLRGYEYTPTKEALLKSGSEDDVRKELLAIQSDRTTRLAIRVRATAALRFFPTADVKTRFESLLDDASTEDAIRRAAVKAYATAFGSDAVPAIARLASHGDPGTREAAIRSLAKIDGVEAKAALTKARDAESDPGIRAVADRAISDPASL